jgi:hypothetical protein
MFQAHSGDLALLSLRDRMRIAAVVVALAAAAVWYVG